VFLPHSAEQKTLISLDEGDCVREISLAVANNSNKQQSEKKQYLSLHAREVRECQKIRMATFIFFHSLSL
jgi:hypothetical protein